MFECCLDNDDCYGAVLTIHSLSHFNRSLEAVRNDILQQLQSLQGAPSVAMHQVPPSFQVRTENAEGSKDGGEGDDVREKGPGKTKDGQGTRKQHGSELYDNVD